MVESKVFVMRDYSLNYEKLHTSSSQVLNYFQPYLKKLQNMWMVLPGIRYFSMVINALQPAA